MTKQRKLIYNIVTSSCIHPTAEEVYEEAKLEMSSIALGTVYRNLSLMVDAGEILRISIPGEPDRFDKTLNPHGHMICVKCGKVIDFSTTDLQDMITKINGIKVLSYEVTMKVICADCTAQ